MEHARPAQPTPIWRERHFYLLLALVALAYLPRLGSFSIRGEESRRAQVAREMLATGDWVVPRQQGEIFADRPPLQNWLLALTMRAVGSADAWTIRLPSVLATLATAVLVYAYSRLVLPSAAALIAGLAYAAGGQVMQLGRLAETEALFTLLVSGSLLGWHSGYLRRLPAWQTWSIGYSLAALAGLTKGLQGPIYCVAPVFAYLVLCRDWRYLASGAHLVGLGVFLALVGAWQVPFSQQVSWELVAKTWGYLAAARYDYRDWSQTAEHMATFPGEVLGCLLPWSLLLVGLSVRPWKDWLGEARPIVVFILVALAVCFPFCWIAPYARTRYFMPLFPLFGPLVGLIAARALDPTRSVRFWRLWQFFNVASGCTMAAVALVVLVASLSPANFPAGLAQPGWTLGIVIVAAVAGIALSKWSGNERSLARGTWAAVALTLFLACSYLTVGINAMRAKGTDTAGAVARLKSTLPPEARLVSLGLAFHVFTFHYAEPVDVVPWPKSAADLPRTGDYFCLHDEGNGHPALPFDWEQIDVVSCSRNRDQGGDRTIIGRRLETRAPGADFADDGAAEHRATNVSPSRPSRR